MNILQKIEINGVKLLIISNTTRLRHNIDERYILSLGKNKFGVERYIYSLTLRLDDMVKIIGLDPNKVDYASPMEYWKDDDYCYMDYNGGEIFGVPIYRSVIYDRAIEVIRKKLGIE